MILNGDLCTLVFSSKVQRVEQIPVINKNALSTFYFYNSFLAQKINILSRCFSDQAFPKITTHYTIHPREKDPRWKGLHHKIML